MEPYGYEVSATHLEYNEAIAAKKPVYMFVRDRLYAEYGLWKKNKGRDIDYQWLREEDVERIGKMFGLIEEHERRVQSEGVSNWTAQFQTSVDLRRIMQRWLTRNAGAAMLNTLIAAGNLPLFSASIQRWVGTGSEGPKEIRIPIQNVGPTPAINARAYINPRGNLGAKVSSGCFEVRPHHLGGTVPPQQGREITLTRVKPERPDYLSVIQICYNTLVGYEIADEYTLVWSPDCVTLDYSGKRLIGLGSVTLGGEQLQPLRPGETPL